MTRTSIGAWIMSLGQLLLFSIFILCMVDLAGLASRGSLLLPLSGYLFGIFTGVAMQFVGSAIPHMKFSNIQ